MKTLLLTLALFPVFLTIAFANGVKSPLLLRKPAVSRTAVVFSFAGDLWRVGRNGGEAVRLTSGVGVASGPIFSPDGAQIAFTGEYEGNRDVYIIPASRGQPRRLTYHPGPDIAVCWSPDGKQVLFRSTRTSYANFTRLFTVPVEGGLPTPVPLPTAFEGSYSPDGSRLAYVPLPPAFEIWKRYRGGRASSISIADLADSSVERIPRTDSNDFNPMWIGDQVYFLSDRNGPITLFAYDTRSKQVRQVLENDGLDIKSASAGPDVIAYEQFGSLHLFDWRTGQAKPLDVRIAGDLAGVRVRYEKAASQIHHAGISPTGVRAVFEARGEIVTVPVEKGDIRNLTNTAGVMERDPAWSPDGKWIAYFSDESGEYELHVREQKDGAVKKFGLGKAPSFYYSPTWSPDGKRIAYTDKRLNLWVLELASKKNTLIDTDRFEDRTLDPVWSTDSRWIGYTKQLKNELHAVFVYNVDTGKIQQLTDGMSDARYPAFDKSGKYLYFTASTDAGAAQGWGMSSLGRPLTRSVYAIVLRNDLPSPLAHESDEEKAEEDGKGPEKNAKKDNKEKKGIEPVSIDFDDVAARTIALPVEPRNYTAMAAGKAGVLYLLETPPGSLSTDGPESAPRHLHRFELEKREAERIVDDVSEMHVSHNGEKILYKKGEGWFIGSADHPKPGEGTLKLETLEVRIDPRAEWKQMYREVWRIERDFLYDPHAHGLDLKWAEKKYALYVEELGSRADLSYLFGEMLGNLTLSHVYLFGGGAPPSQRGSTGLLGADYKIENGRYRFARVYPGASWDPTLRAPLAQPGARVKTGEYLLAVAGQELKPPEDIDQCLEGMAEKAVRVKVGPNADGFGARDLTVVPVRDETGLRTYAWIDDNRRKVDELSGGRVAYVYVPDTAVSGFRSFVRYFFAQVDKEGVVVDERYNRGGILPDYIVDTLRRPRIGYVSMREGEAVKLPRGAIFGPKAMLINEMAGSGGDELPHYFRQTQTGPLIGKRTYGGLVGIDDYPVLMDGGTVTAPHAAFWFPSGQWEVENHGVAPDIEVELDPQAVRAGHDPQLEKAVAVMLDEIKKHPEPHYQRPPYPDYSKARESRR
jgi:tricorn protease